MHAQQNELGCALILTSMHPKNQRKFFFFNKGSTNYIIIEYTESVTTCVLLSNKHNFGKIYTQNQCIIDWTWDR